MATIKIDAATLRANAKTIRSNRETHDTNITAVKTLVGQMCNSEVFDGATATAYLARLESYQATMTQFSQMLEDFAVSLDQVANTFEETDSSLAGMMK